MRSRVSAWITGKRGEQVLRELYVEYRDHVPWRWLSPEEAQSRRYDLDTVSIAKSTMSEKSAYVDAGAHAGTMLKKLVRVAPRGRGFAFEPIPSLSQGLKARFPQVEVREVALGASPGTAEFRHLVDDPANSSLLTRPDREAGRKTKVLEVQVRPLDDCIPVDVHLDFIKVDVEGAELPLLQGAQRILSQDRPVIVFESGPSALHDIGELLGKFDYRIWLLADYLRGAFSPLDDVIRKAHDQAEFYFVCAPAERPPLEGPQRP